MRYFEDLLDSYTQLKKRTFKIRFITEQAADPTMEIIAILRQFATSSAFQDVNDPTLGSGFRARLSKDQSLEVMDKSLQRRSKIADPNGVKMEENDIAKQIWENLYKAFSGEEEAELTPEEKAKREMEAARQQAGERIGGSLELVGIEVSKPIKDNLLTSFDHIRQFIEGLGEPTSDMDAALANLITKPLAYLAGASRFGFEYKLANGQAVEVDENGNKVGVGQINPGLIDSATEAHAMLTKFLAGEGDCDQIASRIGTYGSRLVLFGSEQSDALVIKPNTLHNIALNKVDEQCGKLDLTSIVEDKISDKSKNAVKGTFYEDILQLTHELVTGAKDAKSLKEAFKRVAEKIQDKKSVLEAIARDLEIDVAEDLDMAFERDVILEQLGLSRDDDKLRNFILSEIRASAGFVRLMDADGVIPAGKTSGTGDRADTKFTYSDEAKARKAAKLVGSEAVWNEADGQWEVGVGQKRLKKLKSVKMGEINKTSRMNAIFDESAPVDKDLAPGFYKALDEIQGVDGSRKSKMRSYHRNLEDRLAKIYDQFTKESTYINAEGQIKVNSPEQNFDIMVSQLSDMYTRDELAATPLGRALLSGDKDYKDFSDPKTRARVAELIVRQQRFKAYRENLGKQETRDTIIRQALISGANATGLSQLIVDDNGDSYAYSTNELFTRALGDPNVKIEPAGEFGMKVTGGGVSFTFSQEGTWSGDVRDTRSQTRISKESIEELNKLPKQKREDSSVFLQFLRGQQRLLESLIKQTNSEYFL